MGGWLSLWLSSSLPLLWDFALLGAWNHVISLPSILQPSKYRFTDSAEPFVSTRADSIRAVFCPLLARLMQSASREWGSISTFAPLAQPAAKQGWPLSPKSCPRPVLSLSSSLRCSYPWNCFVPSAAKFRSLSGTVWQLLGLGSRVVVWARLNILCLGIQASLPRGVFISRVQPREPWYHSSFQLKHKKTGSSRSLSHFKH